MQPNPIVERKKQLIFYDPACHRYSEKNPSLWEEICPGRLVLGCADALESYRFNL